MAKFLKPFTRNRAQQNFDRTKITYVKCGKEINIYDEIQANREDTEIIPTLRKYGNLKPLEVDYKGMYGEFQTMNLRDVYEQRQKAEEMYNNLPAEIKDKFNNDIHEFMNKAPEWLEAEIKKQQEPTTPTTSNTNEGVKDE